MFKILCNWLIDDTLGSSSLNICMAVKMSQLLFIKHCLINVFISLLRVKYL